MKFVVLLVFSILGFSDCGTNTNFVQTNSDQAANRASASPNNAANNRANSARTTAETPAQVESDASPKFKNPKSFEWESHGATIVYPGDKWEITAQRSKIESEVLGNTNTKLVPYLELKPKAVGSDKIFLQISDFTASYTPETGCLQALTQIIGFSLLGLSSNGESAEVTLGDLRGDMISDLKYGLSLTHNAGTIWYGCRPTGKNKFLESSRSPTLTFTPNTVKTSNK